MGTYTLTVFRTADGAQSAMGSGSVGLKVERLLYLAHGLSGTVMATDRTGEVKWRRAYLPFGEFAPLSGNAYFEVGAETAQEFGFVGKERESETGLYRLGARWYDPKIGRFISPDPVDGVMNYYAYANNNPFSYQDRNGMLFGGLLDAGEDQAEEIAQQAANESIDPNCTGTCKITAVAVGVAASAWTNDTSDLTMGVAVIAGGAALGAAAAGASPAVAVYLTTGAAVAEQGVDAVGCYAGDALSCAGLTTPVPVDDYVRIGKKGADAAEEAVQGGNRIAGNWGQSPVCTEWYNDYFMCG